MAFRVSLDSDQSFRATRVIQTDCVALTDQDVFEFFNVDRYNKTTKHRIPRERVIEIKTVEAQDGTSD